MSTLLNSVTVRRLIKAERSRVFAAFSSADTLSQWFSPSADITVELLTFEFVPHSKFRLLYTMPDGSKPVVGGVYEIIKPPSQIVFTWMWAPPDPHADIPTRVCVQFHEKGRYTEVVLTHDKLLTKEACDRHAAGWEGTFDRLEPFIIAVSTITTP